MRASNTQGRGWACKRLMRSIERVSGFSFWACSKTHTSRSDV